MSLLPSCHLLEMSLVAHGDWILTNLRIGGCGRGVRIRMCGARVRVSTMEGRYGETIHEYDGLHRLRIGILRRGRRQFPNEVDSNESGRKKAFDQYLVMISNNITMGNSFWMLCGPWVVGYDERKKVRDLLVFE